MLVWRRRYIRFMYTVVFIQQTFRWWLAGAKDRQRAACASRLAATWRGHSARTSYLASRTLALRLQALWRAVRARRQRAVARAQARLRAMAGRFIGNTLVGAWRGRQRRRCVDGRVVFTMVQGQQLSKPYVPSSLCHVPCACVRVCCMLCAVCSKLSTERAALYLCAMQALVCPARPVCSGVRLWAEGGTCRPQASQLHSVGWWSEPCVEYGGGAAALRTHLHSQPQLTIGASLVVQHVA